MDKMTDTERELTVLKEELSKVVTERDAIKAERDGFQKLNETLLSYAKAGELLEKERDELREKLRVAAEALELLTQQLKGRGNLSGSEWSFRIDGSTWDAAREALAKIKDTKSEAGE